MLNADELELLTVAVDGELSSSQSLAIGHLLNSKPEAATLYRALQADALKLRFSTQHPIPVSQLSAVLGRIQPIIQIRHRKQASSRRPYFLPYAVAASIFFAMCSLSFWLFVSSERREQDKVQQRRLPITGPTLIAPIADSVAIAPVQNPPQEKPPVVQPVPNNDVIVHLPKELERAPTPRSAIGDVVGSGIIENPKPLAEIRLRLPFLTDSMEFGSLDVQTRLKQELALDPAFRLDLFSKFPASAFELLQTVAKKSGIAVTIDAKTQELLNNKIPLTVAIYLEGVSPSEIAELLAAVGEQLQLAPKPRSVGMAHLLPIGATEIRDLKETLGIDLTPTRPGRSATGDPKSVAADTLGKVTNAVKKTGEKSGIAFAILPTNLRTPPAQSKEFKAFLDKYSERKTATTPLLIVLRTQG